MVVVAIAGRTAERDALTAGLVEALASRGRRVAVLAASPGPLRIDRPGKDSERHGAAGAREVLAVADTHWARIRRMAVPAAPRLADALPLVPDAEVVLALGFAGECRARLDIEDASAGGRTALVHLSGADVPRGGFLLDKPQAIADLIESLPEEPPCHG